MVLPGKVHALRLSVNVVPGLRLHPPTESAGGGLTCQGSINISCSQVGRAGLEDGGGWATLSRVGSVDGGIEWTMGEGGGVTGEQEVCGGSGVKW